MSLAAQILLLSGVTLAAAASVPVPHARVARQVSQLRDSYDFVIAGGGTAGLTVADRLTEAFPNRTVLVVEYGKIEDAPGFFEPPNAGGGAGSWNLQSLPIPGLNNRTASLTIGKTVGGSSAVNGQFFDRGSRHDYDAWMAVSKPEFDNATDRWDWNGLLPFFKKSVTFSPPPADAVASYGYTWDIDAAYGGSTPIYATYPPFQWPAVKTGIDALKEWGVPMLKECAGGDKAGICWVPTSQDPITAARSFARTGHYDPAKAAGRANYDLLVEHAVNRVLVDKSSPNSPPKVEIKAVGGDGKVTVVSPKLEVILAAGAIHTPHILQKSGIGPAALLKEAGIELVVDLPVGYNFQDHGGPEVSVQLTNDTSASLSQSSFNRDPELTAQARAQYAERPAKGPYTLAMGNTAIYIPLRNITATASFIAGSVVALAASGTKGSPADVYLPPGTPPTVVTGYIAQLKVIADLMNNPEAPYLESPFESAFQGVAAGACMLMHPASRGTVLLDPKNPAAEHPIIDYRSVSAPTDLNVFRQFIKYFRKYYSQSPTLKQLGAVEVSPGANVTSDRDLDAWVRNSMTASFLHPCCTAPMMPQNKGGVVDTTLKVYGVEGLRVVDASMFPLIPGTHTSATVYAVAEKAADIIIRKWS